MIQANTTQQDLTSRPLNIISSVNNNSNSSPTKRKLDYSSHTHLQSNDDSKLSQQNDMFELTPNILDDTTLDKQNELLNMDLEQLKPPKLDQEYDNFDDTTLEHGRDIQRESDNKTPEMLIRMDRKVTPSSYYKDSDRSESEGEESERTSDHHSHQSNHSSQQSSRQSSPNRQQPSHRSKRKVNRKNELGYPDIITDKETKQFLDSYFDDMLNDIPMDDFFSCLVGEVRSLLDKYSVPDEQFKDMVYDKLEGSNNTLSLNKLQARTSEIGFSSYIENLLNEIYESNSKAEHQNNIQEIYMELEAAKAQLEEKEQNLNQREKDNKRWQNELNGKESELIEAHDDLKNILEDEAVKLYKESEIRIKKLLSQQNTRLKAVERDYQNKVRIMNSKLRNISNASNTSLRSSNLSMMASKGPRSDDASQYKAK